MTTSANGLELIKFFEGLRLEAYEDSVGVWTIGYGHTGNVKPGDKITEEEADALLRIDIERSEFYVNRVASWASLNQDQFDALVDLVFNIGGWAFEDSTLRKFLKSGRFDLAANEFPKWNHAKKKVLAGLTKRREAERRLFLGQDWRAS